MCITFSKSWSFKRNAMRKGKFEERCECLKDVVGRHGFGVSHPHGTHTHVAFTEHIRPLK